MPTEPLHDLRVLVGAVIVEDHVDDLTGRDIRLDSVEEADELLVAVALHAAVDDLAWTERRLTPAAFAMPRPVQWVLSPGGGANVRSTTRLTVSAGSGDLPGGRVLSRKSPSMPSCMKRSCQRQTTGFERPERRMISSVPQPSAVARITRARAACF